MAAKSWNFPDSDWQYHRFKCNSCGRESRTFSGPKMPRSQADEEVRRRHWEGQGEAWACPSCRVKTLTTTPDKDLGFVLLVPPALSEILGDQFSEKQHPQRHRLPLRARPASHDLPAGDGPREGPCGCEGVGRCGLRLGAAGDGCLNCGVYGHAPGLGQPAVDSASGSLPG